MTTENTASRPSAAPRRRRRATIAACVAAASVALSTLAAVPASAEPATADELIDAAGRIVQQLPQTPMSNLSAELDLPSLFGILIPDSTEPGRTSPGETAPGTTAPTGERRTSCTDVVQIGDSTSVGIDSSSRVPAEADRLTPQYKRVGAQTVTLNAGGGRSIVERVDGEPNAIEAIDSEIARGHRGCWVIAMGVNDAANIAVGSQVNADQRIDRVMDKLKDRQVLWPTVMTASPSNKAYSAKNMTAFNDALKRAAARHPNLKIYDFAPEAQTSWYVDGIHYNAAGIAQRNRLFATALATAFPR